jgi:D-glycero-D-manno-heptose 1,7-bisphosphate phosphatase
MKTLFLDRDGILNHVVMRGSVVGSPRHVKELRINLEAAEFVKAAKKLGFYTVLVTNQPDIARGEMTRYQLRKIHQTLLEVIPLDHVEVCMSAKNSCFRRKPNPGMLIQSAKKCRLNLSDAFFLGDSSKDMEAGKRAGVKTILYQTDYNKEIHGMGDYNCNFFSEIFSVINANK